MELVTVILCHIPISLLSYNDHSAVSSDCWRIQCRHCTLSDSVPTATSNRARTSREM